MLAIARKILLHERIKFAIAAAGVSVTVMLVLVQVGLYFGFMDNASAIIDHASADIWISARANDNFDYSDLIDDRTYYRALETPGVARAERLLLAFGAFKQATGGVQSVEVVGSERGAQLFRPWNVVAGNGTWTGDVDGIVVDRTEAKKLLFDRVGQRTEIGGVRSRIVAVTSGIRSFTLSPFVFTNLDAAHAYTGVPEDRFTYVLVKAAPGVDVPSLVERLRRIPHVQVFDAKTYSKRVRAYWSERSGVGAGFLTTAALGVVVGLVIVGQILYSGTLEHIREYGTLKAMGAANGAIVRLILAQALISSIVGLVAGGVLACGARAAMKLGNLNVVLSGPLLVATAILTVAMCALAALLSILKVFRLDPATVFKA
jgi:putative ABC transport system permease protein